MVVVEDTCNSSQFADCDDSSTEKPEKSTSEQSANVERQIRARKGVLSYMLKQPVSTMLVKAVEVLSSDGNGASMPAIAKWICGNYFVPNLEALKLQLKKAILKALKSGVLKKSNSSKKSLGTAGSFVLGENVKRKATAGRRKSENVTTERDTNNF